MKQGWDKKSLMDIATVSTGKWDANHATEGGNYRFYTCAYDYLYCNTKRFEGECLILPGNGVNVGEVFYYDGEFDAYQRTYVISDIKILPKYLHYHMLLHWKALGTKQQYGSATNFIKIGNFKDYEVQYPPLPEQQRIVSILDEAFAAIAKAKANAEQNLKNAKELFESYLQGVFENGHYQTLEFGEVCELIGGSQPSKEQFIYEPKEGYIRLIQVRDYRTDKFITYIPKTLAKRFCDKDDIMIGRYGPPIFGIFKGLEGAYNVALMKAVVNEKLCDSTYFYWFLQNNKIREFVEQSSKRAVGQDGVRKDLLEKYPVPVPSLKEQQTIVRQLDALRAETQKLEAVYQKKIDDLEELKKSILRKAFAGELKTANRSALYSVHSEEIFDIAAEPQVSYSKK